ncbi:glycoside hydrolase family 88 protein [Jeotgalibacillus campisalis]|uniref:Unsaturated rhamnogalacturonyl hydrolase n=1 Tax=Jeotgalibacillus campisalis TaxID=220754 RepID=A0A0C2VVQ6_9BACL|nr:glycoside hydrolase family 88 protein [Jeotgalibacillus campisalis]KIL52977.1 hypothetical protein KR50_03060 [Jeotgalibacillus campisalis]
MLIQIVALITLFIVAVIIIIDLLPIISDWLGRIHIGRYDDLKSWNTAITNRGIKWLIQTPKAKITDNTRFVAIDMIRGNYSKRTIQYWQEASLMLGLLELVKYSNDTKAKEKVKLYLNTHFDSDGQWLKKPTEIDSAILAYSIMKINFVESDKYKPALDHIWNLIKLHIGKDGTVRYRKAMDDYRYVDTIGFICPFLIVYGIKYEKNECIDLAISQIIKYEKHGMHKHYFIPCHAYNVNQEIPLGLYGWGRGLGWFAIGLIDSWNELPFSNPHKMALTKLVEKYAKTIIDFQNENGSWNWTVTRPETRSDSSATATLAWFLINAASVTEIEDVCLVRGEKALNFLKSVTRRNGEVDFSQGDTKDIGVYSVLFSKLPFTQGFAIRTTQLYENYGREKLKEIG